MGGARNRTAKVGGSHGGLCSEGGGSVFVCALWWLIRGLLSGRIRWRVRVRGPSSEAGRLAEHQDTHETLPKS